VSLPFSRANREVPEVGLIRGFLGDMVDVVWVPVLAFCVAAWQAMHY
jgi:hypothetical protein